LPKKKVSPGTLHPRREPLLRSAAMTDSGTPSAAAQRRDWSSSLIHRGLPWLEDTMPHQQRQTAGRVRFNAKCPR
jgi:hypothetical protein